MTQPVLQWPSDNPDSRPPWPQGTLLFPGDWVISRHTGRKATIVSVYQENGVQRVSAIYDDDPESAITQSLNPDAFRLDQP
jgi:hypothetical protein